MGQLARLVVSFSAPVDPGQGAKVRGMLTRPATRIMRQEKSGPVAFLGILARAQAQRDR